MSDNNAYWGAWRGGIQQGFITPIKGIGPSGTRNTCKNLDSDFPIWLPGKNYCGNHPHNYYIQIFAETGLVGLTLGILLLTIFIIFTISYLEGNEDDPKGIKLSSKLFYTSPSFNIPAFAVLIITTILYAIFW